MADGRHFENGFISISQPWIIRFLSNLIRGYEFTFRGQSFDKKIEIVQFQDCGRTPYLKSFLAIPRRHIGQLMRNLDRKWITCRYRSRNQNSNNFRKFNMAEAAMLKKVFRRLGLCGIFVINSSYSSYFNRRTSFNDLMKRANRKTAHSLSTFV